MLAHSLFWRSGSSSSLTVIRHLPSPFSFTQFIALRESEKWAGGIMCAFAKNKMEGAYRWTHHVTSGQDVELDYYSSWHIVIL